MAKFLYERYYAKATQKRSPTYDKLIGSCEMNKKVVSMMMIVVQNRSKGISQRFLLLN